jgi:hypothetical protein
MSNVECPMSKVERKKSNVQSPRSGFRETVKTLEVDYGLAIGGWTLDFGRTPGTYGSVPESNVTE